MATDRSLATLLRALQSPSAEQDTSRLFGSATTLLILLTNPLNVTLLSSQLLIAPAIWYQPDGLRTPISILGIFNSAALRIFARQTPEQRSDLPDPTRKLAKDEWITAVVKGADDRSSRWRHLLPLAGLLLGIATAEEEHINLSMRRKIEVAIVKAVNLALREGGNEDALATKSLSVVLSHVFDLLSDQNKCDLHHDLLLPKLYRSPFFDKEGLHSGYFLSTMDADVIESAAKKFDWSTKSSSYARMQRMASGPLVSSLGSISRLVAFSTENVRNVALLAVMVEELGAFARCLCVQWRQNKISEIDTTEENIYLTDETLKTSLPLLWRILKSSMFAAIIILRPLLGRVLSDARLSANMHPFLAVQTLHILRHLYFISSRSGANAFSQYTFVYLTAIDILAQYPAETESFLHDIRPAEIGTISQHPLERCYDLYFLNTSEHFPLVMSMQVNEELLVKAATPYLGLGGDQRLIEAFEAAHSVMLAVFSAPQNTDLTMRHIHPYFSVLFKVFPQNLSARQFRIAVKTLVAITTPPSPISELQPLLPSTILELIRQRLQDATSEHLRQLIPPSVPTSETPQQPALSEQSVLVLALIDALPFLPVIDLEVWLPIVARSLQIIQSDAMLQACRQRFWEVLSSGELDVERAEVCVAWWNTEGGRDSVLFGSKVTSGPVTSGSVNEASKL
ncbi:MAG: hypothetical protein Q9195_001277 [Heterodermia aff. obscurata]